MSSETTRFCLWLALAAAVAACDAEGGGKSDPCEQAAAIRQEAAGAYCAVRTELCCFCACWFSTGYYDIEAYLDDGSCWCVDPPPEETPPACEGEVLEDAESCLDDVEACKELATAEKDLACQTTLLYQ